MSTRRRNAYRKSKENVWEPAVKKEQQSKEPGPVTAGGRHRAAAAENTRQFMEGYIPVAVVMEILASEYDESTAGDSLCRAAVRLAEETGLISKYRAAWDAEADKSLEDLPPLLFDRSQCLELIKYHQRKGNSENLLKEKERLKLIEGRLLLGSTTRAKVRITESDLRKLEEFIKESGF